MGIAEVVVVLDETHRRLHPRARTQPPRARRTITTYNATRATSRAPSPSPRMPFGSGGGSGNRTNNNDDGFGWDANRYAGESGFGSSDIRRGATSPRGRRLGPSPRASLMEKISFQAKQDAAAFKNAASRGISGLKNMASSIFDELKPLITILITYIITILVFLLFVSPLNTSSRTRTRDEVILIFIYYYSTQYQGTHLLNFFY